MATTIGLTRHPVEIAGALEHELKDVEDSFAGLEKSKLADVNATLKAKGLQPITVAAVMPQDAGNVGGGIAGNLADHLLGLSLSDFSVLRGARDERD